METAATPKQPGAIGYILAVLIPIIGLIGAIIQFGRGNVGPGFALLITSSLAFFILWPLILISVSA